MKAEDREVQQAPVESKNVPPSFQLLTLDGLDLPFLFTDASCEPIYLSSRAAKILEIRNRHQLSGTDKALAPFLELVQQVSQEDKLHPALSQSSSLHRRISELTLATTDDMQRRVIAYTRKLSAFHHNPQGRSSRVAGFIVVFHDLRHLEPFFHALDQSRRIRSLTILAASLIGTPLRQTSAGEYLPILNSLSSTVESASSSADLLPDLTVALDIVDQLIAPSVRISVNLKTSFLLHLPRAPFLQLFCHLLVEASDFTGPFGRIRVRAMLECRESLEHGSARDPSVEIAILATRQGELPLEASPLELYIYHRYMPVHYKVTLAAGDREIDSPSTDEELLRQISPTEKRQVCPQRRLSVSDSSLSENLAVAKRVAAEYGVEVDVRRLRTEVLAVIVRLPLTKRPTSAYHS